MDEDRWYWDRRSDKAYYPVATDDDRVALVSVWHRDEVEGAIEAGAFEGIDDVGGDGVGFDFFESFRLPDVDELDGDFGALLSGADGAEGIDERE